MKKRVIFILCMLFVSIFSLLVLSQQGNPPDMTRPVVDGKQVPMAKVKRQGGGELDVYYFQLTRKSNGYGKNQVSFPQRSKIQTASDVLESIPDSDAISYYDPSQKKTIGYISAFGGLGTDFRIIPGKVYEVSVKRDVNWSLLLE